nr:cytochrome p450 3a12 [Quercus suber]
MALLQLLAASFGFSTIIQRYAPQYSLGFPGTAIVLFFLQAAVYLTYQYIIHPRFVSPLRHIPGPKDGDFVLGHTRQIVRESSGSPQRGWVETIPNDGLIRYSVWGRQRVMATTPKAMAEILVTKNYDFIKPWQIRAGLGQILGIGVLLAEGDEHKRQRKHLMPAFAFRHIKELYPTFWSKSREMVACLAEAAKEVKPASADPELTDRQIDPATHAPGTINVGNWTSRATLDIIGLTGMGEDFDSLQNPDNQLNQTYRNVFNPGKVGRYLRILGIFLPFWLLRRIPVQRNRDLQDAQAYIKQLCRDAIVRKRKLLTEKKRVDVDIMSVALESGGFSDEDLVNQMMTFLAAGHETTATAMIWAVYILCKHPDIQTKLRHEIRAKIPSLNGAITAADIDNCHYLSAFCNEVLRLWAPVAITIRVADKDTSVCGHFIPKGTTVVLPPWAINQLLLPHLPARPALLHRPEVRPGRVRLSGRRLGRPLREHLRARQPAGDRPTGDQRRDHDEAAQRALGQSERGGRLVGRNSAARLGPTAGCGGRTFRLGCPKFDDGYYLDDRWARRP